MVPGYFGGTTSPKKRSGWNRHRKGKVGPEEVFLISHVALLEKYWLCICFRPTKRSCTNCGSHGKITGDPFSYTVPIGTTSVHLFNKHLLKILSSLCAMLQGFGGEWKRPSPYFNEPGFWKILFTHAYHSASVSAAHLLPWILRFLLFLQDIWSIIYVQ